MKVSKSSTFVALLLLLNFAASKNWKDKTGTITVHVIPHSHCDPGWLQTYEEYYDQYVDQILSGVTEQLDLDPTKTFVWAEISFFKLWWERQSIYKKESVKRLVENKQLEFVGGGWVQNDEAASSIDLVINQITEGHEYLLRYFGVKPRIGWQIDPFGHSSLTPTIFSQVGYEALVINRINHNLKSAYKESSSMEFMWRASSSLGNASDMFTHVLHTHYSAPQGFDWEEGSMYVTEHNAHSLAEGYSRTMKDRSKAYRTNHLLVPFGDDFKFRSASTQFSNMDKLIREINENPDKYGIEVKYSTLSEYFNAVSAASVDDSELEFPQYHGDFFPYADNEDSYWTGYYTSRPFLKGLIRETLSTLRSADMLYAFNRLKSSSSNLNPTWDVQFSKLQQARWDTSLTGHHDAVTGTARAHVVTDYINKLNSANDNSRDIIATASQVLLARPAFYFGASNTEKAVDTSAKLKMASSEHAVIDTTEATLGENAHMLAFHNSLGWERKEVISVRISASNVQVYDPDGNVIESQVNPVWKSESNGISDETELNVFELFFEVTVPALGLSTYYVKRSTENVAVATYASYAAQVEGDRLKKTKKFGADDSMIENEHFSVTFGSDGFMSSLFDKAEKKTVELSAKYFEYHVGRSGAYLFRPEGQDARAMSEPTSLIIVRGKIVEQAVIYSAKTTQTIRLYRGANMERSAQIIHSVGDLNTNTEVVVRYLTSLKNGEVFHTDNGIEMRRREVNEYDKRAEANYYPVQSMITIQEDDSELAVLSRQIMGGRCSQEGAIELMLHRSLGQDDGRGLSEAMMDHTTVVYKQVLLLDDKDKLSHLKRKLQFNLEHPIRVSSSATPFSITYWRDNFLSFYEPLKGDLPENIHLQKLEARDEFSDEISVNFLNYYEVPHGTHNSASVDVNIDELFKEFKIEDVRLVTLTHSDESERRKLTWPASDTEMLQITRGAHEEDYNGEKQNSDEEGVFVSQSALDNKKKAAKEKQNTEEDGVFVSKNALENEKDNVKDTAKDAVKNIVKDPNVNLKEQNQRRKEENQKEEVLKEKLRKERQKKSAVKDAMLDERDRKSQSAKQKKEEEAIETDMKEDSNSGEKRERKSGSKIDVAADESKQQPLKETKEKLKKRSRDSEKLNEDSADIDANAEGDSKAKRKETKLRRESERQSKPREERTEVNVESAAKNEAFTPKKPKTLSKSEKLGRKLHSIDEDEAADGINNKLEEIQLDDQDVANGGAGEEQDDEEHTKRKPRSNSITIEVAPIQIRSAFLYMEPVEALSYQLKQASKDSGFNTSPPEFFQNVVVHNQKHQHDQAQGGVSGTAEHSGGKGGIPDKEHPSKLSPDLKGKRDRPQSQGTPKINPYLAGKIQNAAEGETTEQSVPKHKDLFVFDHNGESTKSESFSQTVVFLICVGLVFFCYRRLKPSNGKSRSTSQKGKSILPFTFHEPSREKAY